MIYGYEVNDDPNKVAIYVVGQMVGEPVVYQEALNKSGLLERPVKIEQTFHMNAVDPENESDVQKRGFVGFILKPAV